MCSGYANRSLSGGECPEGEWDYVRSRNTPRVPSDNTKYLPRKQGCSFGKGDHLI